MRRKNAKLVTIKQRATICQEQFKLNYRKVKSERRTGFKIAQRILLKKEFDFFTQNKTNKNAKRKRKINFKSKKDFIGYILFN